MNKHSFYIKDFYYIKDESNIDLSFLPSLMRRKLSMLDKFALASMNKIYTTEVEEIVFASRIGEIDRLNKIIDQYQEFDEVSPAQFSASVHNYPVGLFCLYNKINIPYYAVSAGDETFKSGLIKSVLSEKNNVMFTFADDFAFCCLISKTEGNFTLDLENISDFESLIKFLGENS